MSNSEEDSIRQAALDQRQAAAEESALVIGSFYNKLCRMGIDTETARELTSSYIYAIGDSEFDDEDEEDDE